MVIYVLLKEILINPAGDRGGTNLNIFVSLFYICSNIHIYSLIQHYLAGHAGSRASVFSHVDCVML